jgi:hypothetical protein
MQRKDALLTMATVVGSLAASATARSAASTPSEDRAAASVPNLGKPLHPPAGGPVQVAFVIGPDLVAIDLFGPWAAFSDAFIGPTMMMDKPLFNLYAVAATTEPLDQGGLSIQPQYSFKDVPQPHVVVVPMQKSLPATITCISRCKGRLVRRSHGYHAPRRV